MYSFMVNTGFGYILDSNGKIVSKYELPIGKHMVKKGFKFIEVANREELNKIKINNLDLPNEFEYYRKIKNEIKMMAVERLKARGELPNDYDPFAIKGKSCNV